MIEIKVKVDKASGESPTPVAAWLMAGAKLTSSLLHVKRLLTTALVCGKVVLMRSLYITLCRIRMDECNLEPIEPCHQLPSNVSVVIMYLSLNNPMFAYAIYNNQNPRRRGILSNPALIQSKIITTVLSKTVVVLSSWFPWE